MFVSLGDVSLHWSQQTHNVFVRVQEARVTNATGAPIAVFNDSAISPSWLHLLLGQFKPRVILLYSPVLSARRGVDGRFDFGVDMPEMNASEPKLKVTQDHQVTALEQMLTALGQVGEGEASVGTLSALRQIEIRGARLNVSDDVLGSEWVVPLVDMLFTSTPRHGIRADLDVFFDIGSRDKNSVAMRILMPPHSSDIKAAIRLRNFSSDILTSRITALSQFDNQAIELDGDVQAMFSSDLHLRKANVDLNSKGGVLSLAVYEDNPLAYQDVHIKATYDEDSDILLNVDDVSMNVAGVPVRAQVKVKADSDNRQRYDIGVKAFVDRLVQQNFKTLWPVSLHYVGAYEWLSDKISNGTFSDGVLTADLGLDLTQPAADQVSVDDLSVTFDFDDMQIDYRHPMPPVTQAKGHGRFDYVTETVRVQVDSAKLGGLTLSQGDVSLAHIIESGHGDADIYIGVSGQLADVFSVLESKPIAFDHGYDLQRMAGSADLKVNVQLPTHGHVGTDDVVLDVRGKVSDARVPHILRDVDLSAANARVIVHDEDLNVVGDGDFMGQRVHFDYQRFLESADKPYREKARVQGMVDAPIREKFGVDVSSFLSGMLNTDLTYTGYAGNKQDVRVEAGLENARVFVDALGYEKPLGDSGQASLSVKMHDGVPQDVYRINVSATDLDIRGADLDFDPKTGALSGGRADNIVIGKTAGDVSFSVDAKDQYRLEADLKRLDMRSLVGADKVKDDQDASDFDLIASVRAAEALTHEGHTISGVQIYMNRDNTGRFQQLELDASVGAGSIYLRYKPDTEGVRKFRFEADDAGATLAAFGLYPNIRGGKILVHAEPTPENVASGNLLGVAEISDFKVVKAPTLAKLLSLASIDGFAQGISERGINFARLETQFDWQYRPEGSLLVLEKGGSSGSAVGITFDGLVDQAAGTMDVSGTLVPMSQVNNAIRAIPLIGEVLLVGRAFLP